MIISELKPKKEILKMLEPSKSVFIVGCAACATKCQAGGEKEVEAMKKELARAGKKISGTIILDTPCDGRIVKKELISLPAVRKSDALLIMTCGVGLQTIGKLVDKVLIPALNPLFVGTTERIGRYYEYCSLCGDCRLDKFGGFCPLTRCAKGLLNGPCGGARDGKCEVNDETDCIWNLIYEKLRALPKGYYEPRNYEKLLKPGKRVSR
jgi:ferredoxin